MATLYLVRVELVGVAHGSETYTKLHTKMEAAGLTRQIASGGTTYKLPPAEYALFKEGTDAPFVKDSAVKAGTGLTVAAPKVVVARSSGAATDFAYANLET